MKLLAIRPDNIPYEDDVTRDGHQLTFVKIDNENH